MSAPQSAPVLNTDLFVRSGSEVGEGVGHHSATLPSAGDWAPSVYPGHSQGGEGCRECAVQRPKYNSPELLLLLLPRGSCQPGGAQPRCSGWQPGPSQPDLNLVQGPRQPPQLEPRTPPTGSARRQRCNQIFRSVNATDCLSLFLFLPPLTAVVGHLMGDKVWIRVEQQCGTPLSRLPILSALRGGEVEGGGGCIGWWM